MFDLAALSKPEVFWSAVQGLGTVITALIAYFVYLEARSIRRIEWAFHAAGKWQEFNRFLVEMKVADRWEAIRSGAAIDPPLGPDDKRMLLMYFNIQMIEYYLVQKRIVPKHALVAMKTELAMFAPHETYLRGVLSDGGYDPAYVAFVNSCLARQ